VEPTFVLKTGLVVADFQFRTVGVGAGVAGIEISKVTGCVTTDGFGSEFESVLGTGVSG